jgi:hypothetical protein
MNLEFLILTHARAVRDRLAQDALQDATRHWQKGACRMEGVLRAEGNWERDIQELKELCQQYWNGDGIPDWSYLNELRAAITYIAAEEKARISPSQNESVKTEFDPDKLSGNASVATFSTAGNNPSPSIRKE